MNHFINDINPLLQDFVWQSTLILLLGTVAARALSKSPIRAYHVLLLSAGACLALPLADWVARRMNLGLLPTPSVEKNRQEQDTVARSVPAQSSAPIFAVEPKLMAPVAPRAQEVFSLSSPLRSNWPARAEGLGRRTIEWNVGVAGVWVLMSSLVLLRFFRSLAGGRRLISRSQCTDDVSILNALARAARALDISRTPSLRVSGDIQGPAIWCWSRGPIILVPANLLVAPQPLDWESLFCHELAHWKRRDHLATLLVESALAVLPWQPLLWWTRSQLNRLREIICDDWVLYAGQSNAGFAGTLLNLVPSPEPASAFPAVGHQRLLKARIRRILSSESPTPILSQAWRYSTLGLVCCLILVLSLIQEKTVLGAFAETKRDETASKADSGETNPRIQPKAVPGGGGTRMLRVPPTEFYTDVALSPDGKWLAGGTWDWKLTLVDTATGQRRDVDQTSDVTSGAVWSADGAEVAFVSYVNAEKKSFLKAYSQKDDRVRTLMENAPEVLSDWLSDRSLVLGQRYDRTQPTKTVLIRLADRSESVLAETRGGQADARFSHDGEFVLLVTKDSDQSVLHLRKSDGSYETQYKGFPGLIQSPRWSPDGKHIVFIGEQQGIRGALRDLWTLRFDGKDVKLDPVPIQANIDQVDLLNWTRSGQLLHRCKFNLGGLFLLPVDLKTGTTEAIPRRLFRSRAWITTSCWSPDSEKVAVFSDQTILLISAKTGKVVKELAVAEVKANYRGISWAPDGKRLALSGVDSKDERGIFLVNTDSGAIEHLVTTKDFYDVTWSPDGKRLAYGSVWVIDLERKEPTRLANGYRPSFAPDGKSVAYMTGPGGTVKATSIDGKETQELFRFEDNRKKERTVNIFGWSPDGRFIVFTPGNNEIWAVKVPGGEPYKLADLPEEHRNGWAWFPRWSPDGKTIAFGVGDENHQYWVMENFLPN